MLLSPELALVDPELAAVARALLPEPRVAPAAVRPRPRRDRSPWRARRRDLAVAAVGVLAGTALGGGISRVDQPTLRSSADIPAAPSQARTVAVGAPVTVRWAAPSGASYFDFVLWHGGRRVFDAWPATAAAVVPAAWTYRGKRYELEPGRYTWFVYAGAGRRSEARYTRLAAWGDFAVARAAGTR